MIKTFLIFGFILASFFVDAQNIYLQQPSGHVYEYLSNGYLILKTEIVCENGSFIQVTDIAVDPDGKLFALSKDRELMEVDWESGLATKLTPKHTIQSVSLVSSQKDRFIYLDFFGDIVEYDIRTHSKEILGSTGLTTPGDVTLHKGNVIFPTYEKLMAYNIALDSLYTLFCFENRRNDFGITKISSACSNDIFILPANKFDQDPLIYTINAEKKISLSLPQKEYLQGSINGMASSEEFLGLDCPSEVVYPFECMSTSTDLVREKSLRLSPNPSDGIIHIHGGVGPFELTIRTITGHTIEQLHSVSTQIGLGHLPSGIYLVEIKATGKKEIQRLVVR